MRLSDRASSSPSTLWIVATLAVCALLQCAPLLLNGPLPLGSDVFSTNHYLQGFMKAFGEGDWYPRWTDRTNQNLGAPSFVMFPPLTYYGAGAASWLTGSTISGFKLYLFMVALAAGTSFYWLARQWIGPGVPAALAAGIYLLLPYHLLDRYQRFAMSESTAFVFLPLILLFARRAILVGRPGDFSGLSLAYAWLIYTHIVTALTFSLLLGPWLLWQLRGRWREFTRPALALAGGLCLAAPALLPAVVEKSHANIAWNREMPNGDYRINFIFRDDVLPRLGFKDPVKPPVLKSAHSQLALAGIAAGLALARTASSQRRRRNDILVLAAGCAVAYLLQLEMSTPVWMVIPELPSIQFPWRFQTIMVLTTALLAGFVLSAGWGRSGGAGASSQRLGRLLSPAGLLLAATVAVNLWLAWQNSHMTPFAYNEAVARHPGVVSWTEPAFTPVQFLGYRRFQFQPLAVPETSFTEGNGEIGVISWESSQHRLAITSPNGGTVTVRSFWFPGWTGEIDGRPLELRPSERLGLITFSAPAGEHEVSLRFGPTPVRRAAAAAGWAGVVAVPMLAWWTRRRPGAGAGE